MCYERFDPDQSDNHPRFRPVFRYFFLCGGFFIVPEADGSDFDPVL
jgi:hypothetical protein